MISNENMLEIIITPQNSGTRLDVFIAAEIPGLTRSAAEKLIKSGAITVNSAQKKAGYLLRQGESVQIDIPEPTTTDILPENIPLNVLYEDNEIIVVNKPKNMAVHPSASRVSGTLVNALLYRLGDELSGINGVIRPGIVHRIDMDTTGVLVCAKTNAAHISLSDQLMRHSMNRVYYTVVSGRLKDSGTIDKPIGRAPSDRKKMAVVASGRNALTHYKTIELYKKHSFAEVRLETGRTHQIRVHMASIGCPVLGDMVYGAAKQPWGLTSQVLHAGLLGLIHPRTGEYMEFTSPLPEYFEELLKKL